VGLTVMTSIINERKNHANFQLIIITHDENFLRKLGQGDVMDYYWYASPKFNPTPILSLRFARFAGGFPGIHDKNPLLRGRDSAKVAPYQSLTTPRLLHAMFYTHCIFITRIHTELVAQIMRYTKECINGQNHDVF